MKEMANLELFRSEDKKALSLKGERTLIGSNETCSLCLPFERGIVDFHCIIIHKGSHAKIIDFETGLLFINDQKVKSATIYPGDKITLGDIHYILKGPKNSEAASPSSQIQSEGSGHLVQVDDEYVDLKIIESPAPILNSHPLELRYEHHPDLDHYKNVDDPDESLFSDEVLNKGKKKERPLEVSESFSSLEILILSRECILNCYYIEIKNRTIYAAHKSNARSTFIEVPFLSEGVKKKEFIKIVDENVEIFPLEGYNISLLGGQEKRKEGSHKLGSHDVLLLKNDSIHILIKKVASSPSLPRAPFFGQDQKFNKILSKVMGATAILMLLLIFFKRAPEKKEPLKKEVAIIYKKQETTPDSNQQGEVAISPDASLEKTETAAQSAPPPPRPQKVAKRAPEPRRKKAPQRGQRRQKKKVAQARPKLNFLNNAMGGLFAKNAATASQKKAAFGGPSESNNNLGLTGSKGTKGRSKNKIGKLGRGTKTRNYGAKGLVHKKGIVASSIPTKTVVLGSIDPELLRKILREYLPQFKHCYQKELELQSAKTKGVIDLNFTINGRGRVSKVAIDAKGSKFSRSGINCMTKVLKIIEFPKPKGGGVVDVRQPLNFYKTDGPS